MAEKLTIEIDIEAAKNKALVEKGYLMGLEAAAQKCENFAAQCCGGSGEGGGGYLAAADAIRKISPFTGY